MNVKQTCGDGRRARPGAWAAVAAVLLSALPVAAGAAGRVALVIGNSAYKHVPALPNPPKDAADVGAAFERLGYAVTRLEDAGYDELRRGLLAFEEEAARSEIAVVFYAGHGIEMGGENYLVPVDARLERDRAVKHEAMGLHQVIASVEGASTLGMVILDACRDNPFAVRSSGMKRSVRRGLARVKDADLPGTTIVAYAAKEGTTADDGKRGGNSPYTKALLKYLEEPGLEVGRLFRKVRAEVLRERGDQEPVRYGELPPEDVYLASAAAPIPTPGGTGTAGGGAATTLPPTPEAVEKGLGLDLEQRRLVQMGLAAAGHDPGHADGLFGSGTRGALESWQRARGLEATGYLTREQGEVLAALGREAAVKGRVGPPGTKLRDCPQCPELVVVPEGTYRRGSPESESGRDDDEGPVRRVTIGYRLAVGVKEVTRGEFARFVSETGRSMGDSCWVWDGEWKERSGRNWKSPGYSQTDEHPVVCVSWDDAKAYVRWLTGKTGESYRLPSEAEWEYVARAGTETARYWGEGESGQCRYANGADETYGWSEAFCDDGHASTAPVGSFAPNGYKLHDVLGNVWEWTEDCWNESYTGAPSDGSAWESGDCSRRVLRGGSWLDEPRDLRSALRFRSPTGIRYNDLGFRVARTLTP